MVRTVSRPDQRAGSVELSGGDVDISARVPRAYRIVYRVETTTKDGLTEQTEEALVRRPFASRLTTRDQAKTPLVTVSAFGVYSLSDQAFFVQPGAPDPDRRPAAVLPEAVRDGYAQRREVRRVAGRMCRVFRIGESSDAVSLPPIDDLGPDRSDICVDAAGLILEEVTFTDERMTKRRVATAVAEDPAIGDDDLDVAKPEGDPKVIGSVLELEDDSRMPADEFWELSEKPEGFRFRGRFAIVPPGQQGFQDPMARGTILAFMSEVWVDGSDVLVIDRGATRSTKPFEEDANARVVRAGKLGRGELRYALRESEVRVLTGGSSFVRVRGTIEPSRLLAIARSLESAFMKTISPPRLLIISSGVRPGLKTASSSSCRAIPALRTGCSLWRSSITSVSLGTHCRCRCGHRGAMRLSDTVRKSAEAERRATGGLRSLENSIKRLTSQQAGLMSAKLIEKKMKEEEALRAEVKRRPELKEAYADAWDQISAAYREMPDKAKRIAFTILTPSRLGTLASNLVRYSEEVQKPNDKRYPEFNDSKLESLKFGLLSPAPIYPDMEEAILAGWLEEAQKTLGARTLSFARRSRALRPRCGEASGERDAARRRSCA